MFRLMQKNWVIWMRVVAVIAAVMAILVSASVMSPEFDHRGLPIQPAVVSAVDFGVADDGLIHPDSDAKCQIGHSCTVATMTGDQLVLTRFDSAPELPLVMGYQPSGAGYLPFHPPRILSPV